MRFIIKPKAAPSRFRPLGQLGRELACYIPPCIEWKQLNYGQGEGQVEIGGSEWGFYQTASGGLAVELHKGECSAMAAFEFARKIAEFTCEGEPFEILLEGTAD